jgi:ABC-type multidrug transport system ATPase subunit
MPAPVPSCSVDHALGVNADDLENPNSTEVLDVSFSNVRFEVKGKHILKGVSYNVKPGQILALMGATGSGKTTLLNALSRRIQCAGTITFGGQRWSKKMRTLLAFVEQEDIVYDTLTVRRSLQYTALLRLSATLTYGQKMERVEQVITQLKIEKCAETVIGNADSRGVSGGERKRLCIATEFLTNPSIVFFDEPTSGLDSSMALMVMKAMRQLADQVLALRWELTPTSTTSRSKACCLC